MARRISATLADAPPGFLMFGGECHLALPAQPGRGGRNQHLALMLQHLLAEQRPVPPGATIAVLTLATDGVDGQSDAAGAGFVSVAGSVQNRSAIDAALNAACSYDYWRERGGLLVTGASGSNVADLVLIHKS